MCLSITKEDKKNIDANTAAPINLMLHSMFCKIKLELNCRNVGDTSQLYPFRSHLETFLNFSKEIQETRLLSKGLTKDTSAHMSFTPIGGNNAGYNTRHEIRENCRGRAHRSPSHGRFLARVHCSFKYLFRHEINFVPKRLYVQISGSISK